MTEDMHEERLHAAEAFGNAIVSSLIDGKPTVLGYLMIGLQERVHIYRRRGASPKGVTSLEEAQGTRGLVVQIKR
jgi:hypothetical protein